MEDNKNGIINEAFQFLEENAYSTLKSIDSNTDDNSNITLNNITNLMHTDTKENSSKDIDVEEHFIDSNNLNTNKDTDVTDDTNSNNSANIDDNYVNEIANDLSTVGYSYEDGNEDFYVVINENGLRQDISVAADDDDNQDDCQAKVRTNAELKYRFAGSVYRSLREKSVKKIWRRKSLCSEEVIENVTPPELSRSQYSLVDCGDLTKDALQVWLGLPEEIKYDPSLDSFRKLYEKEQAKQESIALKSKNNQPNVKRLPLVNSAPHLNNNLILSEINELPEKNGDTTESNDSQSNRSVNGVCLKRSGKIETAKYYTKMTILIGCWMFFTVVFMMHSEMQTEVRTTSVSAEEIKSYILPIKDDKLTLDLKLTGPFKSEQAEARLNSSEFVNSMAVWLERWSINTANDGDITEKSDQIISKESSKPWEISLLSDDKLDFNIGEARSNRLTIDSSNKSDSNQTYVYALLMKTNSKYVTPFTMSYTKNPVEASTGVIYSCLLLVGLYSLIIFEVINRALAAILVSTMALAALSAVGARPSLPELMSWLDVETLLLLFSMMLLVAILAETGLFDFLAVYTFQVTKGKMWPLIFLQCGITAFISTILDNVTTVLLMTPVTIRLCEVMGLDPMPVLMSTVLFSNIGGTATPVGDPPNIIIATNKAVIAAGIDFTTFTLHMTLGIVLVCVQTAIQLKFMYRDTNKLRVNVPSDIQDLRRQISIWRRAADSLPQLSKDQAIVKERLERKVHKLSAQLQVKVKESSKRACSKETYQTTLVELKEKYTIRDKVLLIQSSVATAFVVLVFFLHSIPELNRVSLGWTALLGALLLLILADREDLEPILHRVEWSTLLFFAALFVLMEALNKLGLIAFIGDLTENLILKVDERSRLAVSIVLLLWVSGVTSAFVDNIPLTTMMVRVVTILGSNPNLNLPMPPLIWALSFGACLGGNGTLIGASANVVCAGVAEQHGYKFNFMHFFRVCFPVMIGNLIMANIYLLLCHCVFTWH